MQKQPGFFDLQFRLEDLSKIGDPLIELNKVIEREKFTTILQTARVKDCMARGIVSTAGRKPFPLLLMFKVLVLQSLNNLSDDQTEYMIKDRLSYMRFLGLSMENAVPDAKAIWNYREMFIRTGTLEKLFRKFDRMLCDKGCSARRGTIVDATIVNAPVQRNTRSENKQVKSGEHPFSQLKCRMRLFIRSIGKARATARVLLGALCYNFSRLVTLERAKQGAHCTQSA